MAEAVLVPYLCLLLEMVVFLEIIGISLLVYDSLTPINITILAILMDTQIVSIQLLFQQSIEIISIQITLSNVLLILL
jgi:hypothetical protein